MVFHLSKDSSGEALGFRASYSLLEGVELRASDGRADLNRRDPSTSDLVGPYRGPETSSKARKFGV